MKNLHGYVYPIDYAVVWPEAFRYAFMCIIMRASEKKVKINLIFSTVCSAVVPNCYMSAKECNLKLDNDEGKATP